MQYLEEVELDIPDIGDVVAQGFSLRLSNLKKVWLNRENVRNRNLR